MLGLRLLRACGVQVCRGFVRPVTGVGLVIAFEGIRLDLMLRADFSYRAQLFPELSCA